MRKPCTPIWPLCIALAAAGCGGTAESRMAEGAKLVRQGRLADAAAEYRRAVQIDSSDAEAWRQWGLVLVRRGKIREGYQALNRAAELAPGNVTVRKEIADIALVAYAGDPQKPAQFWERLQRLASELEAHPEGRRPSARIRAYLAILSTKHEDAQRILEAERQKEPLDADLTGILVQAYFGSGREAEGEALAGDWIRQHPNELAMYDLLYAHFANKGRPDQGEQVLLEKVARAPKLVGPVIQLASHYDRNNRPDAAQQALGRLMTANSDYPLGPLAAGEFHAARGRLNQAAAAYRKGIELDPNNRHFYRKELARLEYALGNRAAAKAELDAVLREKPGDVDAITQMQGIVLGEGDSKSAGAAVTTLRLLAEQSPDQPEGWYRLAISQEATGQMDAAMDSADRALSANSTYLPALLVRARLKAATGDAAGALAQSNVVLHAWPTNVDARLVKAGILLGQNRIGEARAELRELERTASNNVRVRVLQALLAASDGRPADAEAQLRGLYKPGDADAEVRDALVRVLQVQRKQAEAVTLLEQEVGRRPDNSALRQQLAEAQLAAGQPDAAIAQYREIISRDDSAITPRLLLGDVLMAQNRNGDAESVLAQAARKDPKNPKALFLYAQSLERQGKTKDAGAGYRQVLAVDPSNALAMKTLGFLLADTGGDLNEAHQLVSLAMQNSNNAAVYMDTLGYIYLKQRKTDLALQTFQTLVQKEPENSTYRYHLGVALLEKGQRAQAKDEMEKALRRSQDPQERQKIQESLSKAGA